MPTYVYKFIDSGETIEVVQTFDEDSLTELAHPSDGTVRAVKKVFQPVGVTFKGSGFYKTDSRGGSAKSAAAVPASTDSPSTSSSTDASSSSSSDGSSAPATAPPAPAKESSSSSTSASSTPSAAK